ncbi:Stub1 protein [Cladochytrium replicatum]|nr:Stub1 protein [Cladochytrium replicatum]
MSRADEHKALGNKYFSEHRYTEAIAEYSTAIIQNPSNAIYYTNRALCYLKTEHYESVINDCHRATEIDPKSVKGYYLLGQALSESSRHNEAHTALTKAYSLGIDQRVTYMEDIASAIRKAKKRKWETQEERRRESESDTYRYFHDLIERDRRRQLELLDDYDFDARDTVKFRHDERLAQLDDLFARLHDKREVPDAFIGKISFEVMTDPVITPSGITYDRTELMQHLSHIGPFDPLSRKHLTEKDLIPNLALKEAIDDFLEKNGWAVDY